MDVRAHDGLLGAAARARIDELAARRSGMNVWAFGDYHRFAKATVWDLGPVLVEECAIGPGQRVLDVATGSGNVAIRAAEAGAVVVASDITAESMAAGRSEARSTGVEVDWFEADVQDLPFPTGTFDVVTSCFGAMFAQDHLATARELVRVCRPGGRIGLMSFTPDGLGGRFFATLAQYLPPPPLDATPPLLWGDEDHVRALFGDSVHLELERRTYVERAASSEAYYELFRESFGPIVALYTALANRPSELESLDYELQEYVTDANDAADGTAAYEYEYLLVIATTAS